MSRRGIRRQNERDQIVQQGIEWVAAVDRMIGQEVTGNQLPFARVTKRPKQIVVAGITVSNRIIRTPELSRRSNNQSNLHGALSKKTRRERTAGANPLITPIDVETASTERRRELCHASSENFAFRIHSLLFA
jgi:hypothetical protein